MSHRLIANPLSNDMLCRGFKGSPMCAACERYRPGPLTRKHSIIVLGKSDKECQWKKKVKLCLVPKNGNEN